VLSETGRRVAFVGTVGDDRTVWADHTGTLLDESEAAHELTSHLVWGDFFELKVGYRVGNALAPVSVPTGLWKGGEARVCGPYVFYRAESVDSDAIVQCNTLDRHRLACHYMPGLDELQLATYRQLRHDGFDATDAYQTVLLVSA
jgi:hypothetical protein